MARPRRKGKPGTPFEVYLAREPLADDQPTIIFQHLQKTAGTALRQVIHANIMAPDARVDATHIVLDVPKNNRDSKPLAEIYDEWWASLSADDRDRIILATSHSANYLLERITRSTRAFTILREPVDRVLSRYYFYTSRRRWTLADLYRNPTKWRDARQQFFNYQSRALLEPHYDVEGDDLAMSNGPPANADEWRERLRAVIDAHYLVGVQERFEESVTLFAREFDWSQPMAPEVRVNRRRPRQLVDDETRDLILAYNWLDVELYRESVEHFDRRVSAP